MIAQLLQHRLLRPSFVPPQLVRQLRDLTRQRARLVSDKTSVANRIAKVLEDANIKLGAVATDILGVSGRLMIGAMIGGQEDPVILAGLARGKLKKKATALEESLEGSVTDHHRFQLKRLWGKSGVGSSFLPEEMNRHRITRESVPIQAGGGVEKPAFNSRHVEKIQRNQIRGIDSL